MKHRKQSKGGYHHGELKEALLRAAESALKADGLQQLSLRAAARRAGVTTAAPYHHFTDRDDLVASLAIRGFERLEGELTTARDEAGRSAGRQLAAVCTAYLGFAGRHAALYEVMFSSVLTRARVGSPLMTAAMRPFAVLAGAVGSKEPLDALMLWSLGHGLAHLAHAGLLGHGPWKGTGKDPASAAVRRLVSLLSRSRGV